MSQQIQFIWSMSSIPKETRLIKTGTNTTLREYPLCLIGWALNFVQTCCVWTVMFCYRQPSEWNEIKGHVNVNEINFVLQHARWCARLTPHPARNTPQERNPVPSLYDSGWARRAVWTDENLAPSEIQSMDRPDRKMCFKTCNISLDY